MGSVACEFSLSPAPSSDPPFPHSEPLLPHPRVSPDLDSRFPPSTATGSEARSTEFTTAGCPVRRFKIGDMVWGAVKSHPRWPGQIFDEACALPIVRRSKVDGHVLVAFFGDSSYGWLDPSDLLPFEPHFPVLSKQEGSPSFVNAVVDAVDEVNRRAALGFVCRCRIPFRPTRVPGYVTVDVPGYEPGDYSMVQIEEARESILPSEVFSIADELAVTPQRKEAVSVDKIRRKALLLAYRRAVFEEVDQAYDEAFGRKTVQPKILNIRDGGIDPSPKKKKGRLRKLRHELPTSDEDDTNLRLSDLLATSRSRQQPEGLSTTRPLAIAGRRPAVGQMSGSPARSSVSSSRPDSSDASTPELQAELQPSNVSKLQPPSEPEPSSVLKPELEPSSVLTTPPVTVTNRATDEVNMAKKIQTPKRHLENPKPKMKRTVKKLKRETPLPEPKLLDVSSDHSEEQHPSPSLNTDTDIPPRVSEFQMSQALSDLRSLAKDVFYEDERNTPKIVNRVFGRFRSMVYRKRKPHQLPVSHVHAPIVTSIVDPATADHPPSVVESKPSLMPPKALAKAVDGAMAGRKSAESDRLEDMSANKSIKRPELLKELSAKKNPKSAVKSATAMAKPEKQFDLGNKKDAGSAAASPELIQQPDSGSEKDADSALVSLRLNQHDSGSEKDADSAVVSLRPNQQLHSEITEVMDSAVAELKLHPELDYARKKDADSAMASAKPIQQLDSTVAELKVDQQLSSGAKKDVGPAVAEPKTNQHLSLGKKKDIGSAVAKRKPKQQLDSEMKKGVGSTVAKLNPNQQLNLGMKNNVGSAVAELKPNQPLDSGTEKEDNLAMPTLLDSGKKKDVASAVATLKPNQQLDTVTKNNDVGSAVRAPQLNSVSKKDVDSAVAELKLNLQLNSGTKKEMDSAVAKLKSNQQHDSEMKTEVGSVVAATKVKPIPQPATPTYLIMKFPSNAVLPKVSYLNMRLSRLGKINESSTGVNLKTNSCRVLFKSRSDAELAFKYVDSRQFFGEVKVEYSLRDVGPRPQKVSKEAGIVERAAVQEIALPAGSTTPVGDAPTRQPVELPKKVVDKVWTTKSAVVKESLPARQPAELPPKPCVEKDVGNVAGTIESGAIRNVALVVRPMELPPKPCIKKAVDKSAATKEVRFSVGGGDSKVEPPVGRPSDPNAGRNVQHVPELLTRPRPPLSPAQTYRGILGPSSLAPPPTMDGGSEGRAEISHKMMSLLVKCNEVVDSVKSSLGYLPYHPI